MTSRARKVILLVAIGVVVLAAVGWQVRRLTRPRTYLLKAATITKLDPQARTAEIEFTHPKSGRTMRVPGLIPADCQIYINDTPATLTDLQVGDSVSGQVVIHYDQSVTPTWVRVKRPVADSAPASAPAEAIRQP